MKETCKNCKNHEFSSLGVYISRFAQTQQNFAPLHNGETVTFRKSAS